MYYSFIGCVITVTLGWIISYFTASPSDQYDEDLTHPLARSIANYFPGKKRYYTDKSGNGEAKIVDNDIIPTISTSPIERTQNLNSAAYSQDVSIESEVYSTKL